MPSRSASSPTSCPIALDADGRTHVFLYLLTRNLPIDFRGFWNATPGCSGPCPRWTVRLLVLCHQRDVCRQNWAVLLRILGGGESGIRTLGPPLDSATCRIYAPRIAVDANDAVAAGTLWHAGRAKTLSDCAAYDGAETASARPRPHLAQQTHPGPIL